MTTKSTLKTHRHGLEVNVEFRLLHRAVHLPQASFRYPEFRLVKYRIVPIPHGIAFVPIHVIRELTGYASPVGEVNIAEIDYLQRQARLHVQEDLIVSSVQRRQGEDRVVVRLAIAIVTVVRIGRRIEQALHVAIAFPLAVSRQRHPLHQYVRRRNGPGSASPGKPDVGVHPRLVVPYRPLDGNDEGRVATVHRLVGVRRPELRKEGGGGRLLAVRSV